MPTFRVTLVAHAEIEVEADDEDQAETAAKDEFQGDLQYVECQGVELVEEEDDEEDEELAP